MTEIKRLVNDYDVKKISFLQYQAASYKLISQVVTDETKSYKKISDDRLDLWKRGLCSLWIYNDPLISKLKPEILSNDTHYEKIKLIGEKLSDEL